MQALRELGVATSFKIFCPKCRSKNVVVSLEEGYVIFSKCNSCGHEV